jgi:Protein of unknown function (DUF3142)
MGQEAALLLVGRRRLVMVFVALALACCRAETAGTVDPRHYDAFFLWPGMRPPDLPGGPKVVYLLAGELRGSDASRFVPLRAVPHVPSAEVWLTVRCERLDWGDGVYRQVLGELARWQAAGNRVAGLQVDFDAATKGLEGYAAFLGDLRRRLPPNYRLSVTGLLDWSAHGDPAALASLGGVVDEVVIQTYQGRSTIPGYQHYMAALTRLPVPHKIGLVEGGEWREPPGLAQDRQFRGYVVFMLKGPAT